MNNKRKIVWNAENDAYLRLHYPDGTLGDIADHFGVCSLTIAKRVKELGLVKSPGWHPLSFYGRYTGKKPRA